MTRPTPQPSPEESTDRAARPDADDSIISGETLQSPAGRSTSSPGLAPLPSGRYLVSGDDALALLGRGGQGEVWKATDTVLRREVALKRLHPRFAEDPQAVADFLREARLTALLEHPGIVPLHDLGTAPDGAPYLVLRLVRGRSFADTLAEAADLDGRLRQVPALLRACQAVAFAHQRGVVHRDLKPQNIMVGSLGETYVVDWGLALVSEPRADASNDITAPQHRTGVVGSPAYMSPEQAMGVGADVRSDVWGLGACLYHLLTGRPPIGGRTIDSAVRHASAAEVAPVATLEPGVPGDLAAICTKALSYRPSARYEDAGALARDLEAWLAGRTVSARSYSMGQHLWRAVRANRALALVSTLAVLALGGLVVADELRVRRERNEARAFVRSLLFDLPSELDATLANSGVMDSFARKTEQWLELGEAMTPEDLERGCQAISRVADFNLEVGKHGDALAFYLRAERLADRGLALAPDDPNALACKIETQVGLAIRDLELGQPAAALARHEAMAARVARHRGPDNRRLRAGRASLMYQWAQASWPTDAERAQALLLDVAKLAEPLLRDDDPEARKEGLRVVPNVTQALWRGEGRARALAFAELARVAAAPLCARDDIAALRTCLNVTATAAFVRAWEGDEGAAALRDAALALDERVVARDADSAIIVYNSMMMRLEQGDLSTAAARARQLSARLTSDTDLAVALLALALGGQSEEFGPWRSRLTTCDAPCTLATALHALRTGDRRAAAEAVRAVPRGTLWLDVSWPSRADQLPAMPAAPAAFARFVQTFGAAYARADDAALSTALDALAGELEEGAAPRQGSTR